MIGSIFDPEPEISEEYIIPIMQRSYSHYLVANVLQKIENIVSQEKIKFYNNFFIYRTFTDLLSYQFSFVNSKNVNWEDSKEVDDNYYLEIILEMAGKRIESIWSRTNFLDVLANFGGLCIVAVVFVAILVHFSGYQ